MSKPTKPLETIDPTALTNVSGGASRNASSDDGSAAIMTALTGILDSIKSIATNQNQGMSSTDMFLMMMMMQNRSGVTAPAVAAQAAPTNWTWDANGGYWIVK
jgi:hypothetical protein